MHVINSHVLLVLPFDVLVVFLTILPHLLQPSHVLLLLFLLRPSGPLLHLPSRLQVNACVRAPGLRSPV